MKFGVLLDMLFELLDKRKLPASYFAEKYGLSIRTVYRYLGELAHCVPVSVKRGRSGGISIADNYKLPSGFLTEEEYACAVDALESAYVSTADKKLLEVKNKLTAERKKWEWEAFFSGAADSVFVHGGSFGDESTTEKLRLLERAIADRVAVEIEYRANKTTKTVRTVEPHLLLLKKGVWSLYAFCRSARAFRLFRLGKIYSVFVTEEAFVRKPFEREEIPVSTTLSESDTVRVKLEITEAAYPAAQDAFGGENLVFKNGKWTAELILPKDDTLPKKILTLGAGAVVVSPKEVQEKVKALARAVLKAYR